MTETSTQNVSQPPKQIICGANHSPLKDRCFADYFVLIHFKTCPQTLKENQDLQSSNANVYDFQNTNPPLSDICWMVIDSNQGKKTFSHEKTHHFLQPIKGKLSAVSQVTSYQTAIQELAEFIQERFIANKKTFRFVTETENHISYMILKSSRRSHFPREIWSNSNHVISLKNECERHIILSSTDETKTQHYNRFDLESVFPMMKSLGIKGKAKRNPSSRDVCNAMCTVLSALIRSKHKFAFNAPSLQKPSYSNRQPTNVVRLRGLPWEASVEDIKDFFENLHVAEEGVLILLNFHGRSTGEAFVKFASEEDGSRALAFDRQFMAHRYIEVFPSSMEEMENAQQFRNHQSLTWDSTIIRLRGLPFSSTLEDVIEFFSDLIPESNNIHMVKFRDGRLTGDAFVEFENTDDAQEAMKLHKQQIGDRYIELFKSSTCEMNIVLSNALYYGLSSPPPLYNNMYYNNYQHYYFRKDTTKQTLENEDCQTADDTDSDEHDTYIGHSLPMFAPQIPHYFSEQQFSQHVIKVRGLSTEANEYDVAHMFGELNIAPFGVHLIIDDEQPSGEAFIEVVTAEDVRKAHKLPLDDGIKVEQSSKQEMMNIYKQTVSHSESRSVESQEDAPLPGT